MAEAESQFWNGVADRWAHYADSVDRQARRQPRSCLTRRLSALEAPFLILGAGQVGPGWRLHGGPGPRVAWCSPTSPRRCSISCPADAEGCRERA